MSFFDNIPIAQVDPILGLEAAFKKDPRPHKINLTAGVYKDQDLKTPVMEAVKQAELLLAGGSQVKSYLPIEGDSCYLSEVGRLVFGRKLWEEVSLSTSAFQTIGGTGALRLGAEMLKAFIGTSISIPSPSWPNHRGVFSQSGLMVLEYPYYDRENNALDFEGLCQFLCALDERSVVLLHACCHNPSGVDLTKQQWQELASICKAKRLLPFIDAAYIGFAEGVEEDCYGIRYFLSQGLEMLVAVSFSKNFSLYGERIGALFVTTTDPHLAERISGQMRVLVRRNYSNPQRHGEEIVTKILQDKSLKHLWLSELSFMQSRIQTLRNDFSHRMSSQITSIDYSYLVKTRGMFCFCGLTKEMVERLIKQYGIYMTYDGRVNIAGLLDSSMAYVVDSIKTVLE